MTAIMIMRRMLLKFHEASRGPLKDRERQVVASNFDGGMASI